MFRKVLVPLDGSSLAEGVLPYAYALAEQARGTITLLHVIDPTTLRAQGVDHPPFVAQIQAHVEEHAWAYLLGLKSRWEGGAVAMESLVAVGPTAQRIVAVAESHGYDLIALSTHGRSSLGRWGLGSVAAHVLHATRLPVLALRPCAEGPAPEAPLFRCIVVPLDSSDLAERALPYAQELATGLDLPLVLVRAVEPVVEGGLGAYQEEPLRFLLEASEGYLRRREEELQAAGCRVHRRLDWGPAAGCIVEVAQAEPGSLVVMATHGRSGLGRWVLGSVADHVVWASGCPVLLVRERKEAYEKREVL